MGEINTSFKIQKFLFSFRGVFFPLFFPKEEHIEIILMAGSEAITGFQWTLGLRKNGKHITHITLFPEWEPKLGESFCVFCKELAIT